MAEEQQQAQDGGGVATAEQTLTVKDNRTGETYEVEITDGTVKAMDFRQMKVDEDDFGLMTYDPAFTNTAATTSSSSARTRATWRSPTSSSTGSFPPRTSSTSGSTRSRSTRSCTRTSSASWRASATTPTPWGCCLPPSARCPRSTRAPRTSTRTTSATW